MKYRYLFRALAVFVITIGLFQFCSSPQIQIHNPYQSIDWENTEQHKANFHTHTVRSDGSLNPQVVVINTIPWGTASWPLQIIMKLHIRDGFFSMVPSSKSIGRLEENPDRYEEPFVFENRDPEALQMIAIQANEVSAPHHTGSFFNAFNDRQENEEDSWQGIADQGGIGVVFPGQISTKKSCEIPASWYVSKFLDFPHLVGLEIYNQGDRYPNDRNLYDSLLTELMPDRNLWAFSKRRYAWKKGLGAQLECISLDRTYHWQR